jgi:hypothetical protein
LGPGPSSLEGFTGICIILSWCGDRAITDLASKFMPIAHRREHQYLALKEQEKDASDDKELSRMRDGWSCWHIIEQWWIEPEG